MLKLIKVLATRCSVNAATRGTSELSMSKLLKMCFRRESLLMLSMVCDCHYLLNSALDRKFIDTMSVYGVFPYLPPDLTLLQWYSQMTEGLGASQPELHIKVRVSVEQE